MYCITCGKGVSEAQVRYLNAHLIDDVWYKIVDSVCFGPFASCPPPEENPASPPEPDEEFMELIESNVIQLQVKQ